MDEDLTVSRAAGPYANAKVVFKGQRQSQSQALLEYLKALEESGGTIDGIAKRLGELEAKHGSACSFAGKIRDKTDELQAALSAKTNELESANEALSLRVDRHERGTWQPRPYLWWIVRTVLPLVGTGLLIGLMI